MNRHNALLTPLLLSLGLAAATTATAGDPRQGESLYQVSCRVCHGVTGEGGFGPRLTGLPAERVRQLLRRYRDGKGGGDKSAMMVQAAGDLSDRDIEDLAAYIATLGR